MTSSQTDNDIQVIFLDADQDYGIHTRVKAGAPCLTQRREALSSH